MFQSLFGSLLNRLYRYANENVSVKQFCMTSFLSTIYSLKNCSVYLAVLTALNHSGSFGKNFVKFKENIYIHMLPAKGRSVW